MQKIERKRANWQPKLEEPKLANKKVFTIKKGKIEPIDLSSIAEFKNAEYKKHQPQGIYAIDRSEAIIKKLAEPQTKLWFYDKRNYVKEEIKDEENLIVDEAAVKEEIINEEAVKEDLVKEERVDEQTNKAEASSSENIVEPDSEKQMGEGRLPSIVREKKVLLSSGLTLTLRF